MNTFGDRLIQKRKETNLSQRAAAALIGIQPASLSSYESGRKSPNLDIAAKIAVAYGCSLDWLCGLFAEEHAPSHDKKSFTQADVFNTFTTLCEYPIPVYAKGVCDDSTLSRTSFFGVDIRISQCYWLFTLLDTYSKLLELYKKDEISYEVLEAWKEKKSKELQGNKISKQSEDEELPF